MRVAVVSSVVFVLVACGSRPPSPDVPARAEPAAENDAPTEDPVRAAVAARLEQLVADTGVPGITAGYVLPGGRSVGLAAGLADLEARTPMAAGDRMFLGSVGKTYVAAVTLQLVAEGTLDLDAPITQWLGDRAWLPRVPNGGDLTLRALMMHRTGIPRHIFTREFIAAVRADPDRVWTPAELVSYVLDAPAKFAIDGGFAYADTNYILVGMVIEQATGKTYYDELRRRVLEPLALAHTAPSISRDMDGLVVGYSVLSRVFGEAPMVKVGEVDVGRVVTDGRYFMNPQLEWTGGGLITTAEDLARWGAALYGGDVLTAAMKDAMLTGKPSPELGGDYGLGAHIVDGGDDAPWGRAVGHEGVMPGYTTVLRYFPDRDVAIAVQINTDAPPLLGHPPEWFLTEVAGALFAQLDAGAE